MAGAKLNNIDPKEKIGRRVFDEKYAQVAQREEPPPKVNRRLFVQKIEGEISDEISVDRLDHASYDDMAEIVHKTDPTRKHRFEGWVFTVVDKVNEINLKLVHKQIADNPYHAHIVLPGLTPSDDKKAYITKHTQALADISKWYYPDEHQ